jgi:hypothetical protein
MRLSSEPSDPGYDPELSHELNIAVYLDGKIIRNVITADEEKGYVANVEGTPPDQDYPKATIVERYGEVKIVFL